MSFDAYHKWLGIPPSEQPAHHYRLLAIAPFESDPDVIETAADQRMALLRTFQTGPQSALSQKLLNEVSAAKLCLLSPAKKSGYDSALRERLEALKSPNAKTRVPNGEADTANPVPNRQPLSGTVPVAPAPTFIAPAPLVPIPTAPVQVAPVAFASPLPVPVDTEPQAAVVSHASATRRVIRPRRSSMSSTAFSWLALAVVAIPSFSFIGYLILDKQRRDAEAARAKQAEHKAAKKSNNGTTASPRDVNAEVPSATLHDAPERSSLVQTEPRLPSPSASPARARAEENGSRIFDDWKPSEATGGGSGPPPQQIAPDPPRRSLADLASSADEPAKDKVEPERVKEIKKSIESRNAEIAKLVATRSEVESEVKRLEQRLPALSNQLSKARKREDAQRTLNEIGAVKYGIKTGRTRLKRIDQEIDVNRRYNETAQARIEKATHEAGK